MLARRGLDARVGAVLREESLPPAAERRPRCGLGSPRAVNEETSRSHRRFMESTACFDAKRVSRDTRRQGRAVQRAWSVDRNSIARQESRGRAGLATTRAEKPPLPVFLSNPVVPPSLAPLVPFTAFCQPVRSTKPLTTPIDIVLRTAERSAAKKERNASVERCNIDCATSRDKLPLSKKHLMLPPLAPRRGRLAQSRERTSPRRRSMEPSRPQQGLPSRQQSSVSTQGVPMEIPAAAPRSGRLTRPAEFHFETERRSFLRQQRKNGSVSTSPPRGAPRENVARHSVKPLSDTLKPKVRFPAVPKPANRVKDHNTTRWDQRARVSNAYQPQEDKPSSNDRTGAEVDDGTGERHLGTVSHAAPTKSQGGMAQPPTTDGRPRELPSFWTSEQSPSSHMTQQQQSNSYSQQASITPTEQYSPSKRPEHAAELLGCLNEVKVPPLDSACVPPSQPMGSGQEKTEHAATVQNVGRAAHQSDTVQQQATSPSTETARQAEPFDFKQIHEKGGPSAVNEMLEAPDGAAAERKGSTHSTFLSRPGHPRKSFLWYLGSSVQKAPKAAVPPSSDAPPASSKKPPSECPTAMPWRHTTLVDDIPAASILLGRETGSTSQSIAKATESGP